MLGEWGWVGVGGGGGWVGTWTDLVFGFLLFFLLCFFALSFFAFSFFASSFFLLPSSFFLLLSFPSFLAIYPPWTVSSWHQNSCRCASP
jgi:hypothetical protein